MTITISHRTTLRRRASQQGARALALAFSPSRRHHLLLCFLLLFTQLTSAAHEELQATLSRTGASHDVGHSYGASAQRLRDERPARDLLENPNNTQRSDASATLPRLLSSTSISRDGDSSSRSNSSGGDGSDRHAHSTATTAGVDSTNSDTSGSSLSQAQGAGGGSGAGASSEEAPPSRPLSALRPPSHPHPQHLICGYDRVTATDAGGGCGPHRVAVEFVAFVVVAAAAGGGGAAAAGSGGAAAAGGGANLTRMCASPAAFSSETGTLSMSLCWRLGDVPDQLLAAAAAEAAGGTAAVLRITLPQLATYGISSMAPGKYSMLVDGADAFGAVVHAATAAAAPVVAAASSSASVGDGAADAVHAVLVPTGGAAALTLLFELRACAAAVTNITGVSPAGGQNKSGHESVNGSSNSSSNGTGNGNGNGGVSSGNGGGGNGNGNSSTSSNSSASDGSASGSGGGMVAAVPATASRTLTVSLVGAPRPPPAATTCKCAPVATPAAAAAAATFASMATCASGLVPLVASILPPGKDLPSNTTTGTNGTNGINGINGAVAGADTVWVTEDDGNGNEDGGGSDVRFVQCVPLPLYDRISRRLAFSICWRYACLPTAFSRRPYELLLGPVSYTAATAPPAGSYKLSALLPEGVGLSYEYTTRLGGPWTAVLAASGAENSAGVPVTLPYLGAGQMRIRIQIPFDMDVDGSAGSLELKLLSFSTSGSGTRTANSSNSGSGGGGGSSSSNGGGSVVALETADGAAVTPPPLPSAVTNAAAANNNNNTKARLVAVSELWLSRRVGSGSGGAESTVSELADLVRRGMETEAAAAATAAGDDSSKASNVSVTITLKGYRLSLPLQFQDFSSVADCGADSLTALRAGAAAALADAAAATTGGGGGGASAAAAVTLLSVGCSYGAYSGGRRRRLQQQQQTCTARLSAPVAVDTPPLDLDAFLSSSTAALSSTYGESMCLLDPGSSDIQVLSKLEISVTMSAAGIMAASSAGGAAAASASACTAGAQVLAASLGLNAGEAMVVACQLSAAADPAATPEAGSGGAGGGGETAAGGGGGGGGGKQTALIAIAAGAGGTVLAALVVGALVVRQWQRRRSSRFPSSEASTGQRTFDSISSMSPSDILKASNAAGGSADSVGLGRLGLAAAAAAAAPLTDAKRCRRDGGGGGDGGGDDESSGMLPSSSKSLMSYGDRRCLSTSPQPSVYGTDSVTGSGGGGGCGGIGRAGALSVVAAAAPLPATAAGKTAMSPPDPLRQSVRRSTYCSGDCIDGRGACTAGVAGSRPFSSCPVQIARRGIFSWASRSQPGLANDSDNDTDGGGAAVDELYDVAVQDRHRSCGSRCSRATVGLRSSNNGGTVGGWYDFFGLDGGSFVVAGGGGGGGGADLAGAIAGRPTGNSNGGGSTDLAARRRSSDSGGRRCSAHVLRRSNGGNLAVDPLPPPSRLPWDSDGGDGGGDGGGGGGACRRMSATVRTSAPYRPDPLERHTAPGSTTMTAPPSPLSPRSPRRTLRPLHFGLPGIAELHLPGADWNGGDEDLPYGADPFGRGGGGGGGTTAPGEMLPEDDERDLLRVQSRRPAFLDRTGGSLAAAVAATVSMPYIGAGSAGGGSDDGGGGGAAAAAGVTRDTSTRIEPRRGGFIRRSAVAPYLGSTPPSYTSYIRSQNCAGSATAAIGGGGGGGYQVAWSTQGSPVSSPSGASATLAGVIGGRRRSSGGGAAAAVASRFSSSGAAAALDDDDAGSRQQGRSRSHSPTAPPPSPSAAAAAPQWMGGLSRRARRPKCVEGSDDGGVDDRRPSAASVAAAAMTSVAGSSGVAATAAAAGRIGTPLGADQSYSSYKVRRPPRVQTSGGLGPEQDPELLIQGYGGGGGGGGFDGGGNGGGGGGAGGGDQTGLGSSPLAPRRLRALLQPPTGAAGDGDDDRPMGRSPRDVAELTHGSIGTRPTTAAVSVTHFAAATCKTAPAAALRADGSSTSSPYSYGCTSGSTSGADGGAGGAGGRRLDELSPAFGPTAAMRARQLYKRSSSCGSSNDAVSYGGMSGLVDREVEANAESGAARLVMIKRLAVGPPRPAWGLVHAGVQPMKRSIASVQYIKSIHTRVAAPATPGSAAVSSAAVSSSSAVSPSAAAAAAMTAAGYKRRSVPGRMLMNGSTGSSRDGGGDVSRNSSREASGPFLRLV